MFLIHVLQYIQDHIRRTHFSVNATQDTREIHLV